MATCGRKSLIGQQVKDAHGRYPTVRILSVAEDDVARRVCRESPAESMVVDVINTIIDLRRETDMWERVAKTVQTPPGWKRNQDINTLYEREYEGLGSTAVVSTPPSTRAVQRHPVQQSVTSTVQTQSVNQRDERDTSQSPAQQDAKAPLWTQQRFTTNDIIHGVYNVDTMIGKRQDVRTGLNDTDTNDQRVCRGGLPARDCSDGRQYGTQSATIPVQPQSSAVASGINQQQGAGDSQPVRSPIGGADGGRLRFGISEVAVSRTLDRDSYEAGGGQTVVGNLSVGVGETGDARSPSAIDDTAFVGTIQNGRLRVQSWTKPGGDAVSVRGGDVVGSVGVCDSVVREAQPDPAILRQQSQVAANMDPHVRRGLDFELGVGSCEQSHAANRSRSVDARRVASIRGRQHNVAYATDSGLVGAIDAAVADKGCGSSPDALRRDGARVHGGECQVTANVREVGCRDQRSGDGTNDCASRALAGGSQQSCGTRVFRRRSASFSESARQSSECGSNVNGRGRLDGRTSNSPTVIRTPTSGGYGSMGGQSVVQTPARRVRFGCRRGSTVATEAVGDVCVGTPTRVSSCEHEHDERDNNEHAVTVNGRNGNGRRGSVGTSRSTVGINDGDAATSADADDDGVAISSTTTSRDTDASTRTVGSRIHNERQSSAAQSSDGSGDSVTMQGHTPTHARTHTASADTLDAFHRDESKIISDYALCDATERSTRKKELLDGVVTFHGTEDIDEWLAEFANLAFVTRVPRDVAAPWIFTKFRDTARQWTRSGEITSLPDFKWRTIYEMVRQRFSTGVSREDKIRAFKHKVLRPGQPACSYADEMYYMRSVCYGSRAKTIVPDEELMHQVYAELPYPYRYELDKPGSGFNQMNWTQFRKALAAMDKMQGTGGLANALNTVPQVQVDPFGGNQQRQGRRGRSRGGWRQRQGYSYSNEQQPRTNDNSSNAAPQDENRDVQNVPVTQPGSTTVLCTVQQPPVAPTSSGGDAAPKQKQTQYKNRPCRFCMQEGFGECFHGSWSDCPCKKWMKKEDGNKSNSSGAPDARQGSHYNHRGRRQPRANDNKQQQQPATQAATNTSSGVTQARTNTSTSAASAATATANVPAQPKVFKSNLVLRIGSLTGLEGRPGSELNDVRRILTANVRRPTVAARLSEAKMVALVHSFMDSDARAVEETNLAVLNESITSDLINAWTLTAAEPTFMTADKMTPIFRGTTAQYAGRHLIIPRWNDVLHLRRLLDDDTSRRMVNVVVIPLSLLPILDDKRVDIPIMLPRVRNMFMKRVFGVLCGVEKIVHIGNAERLFLRCQWVAILVSTDKQRCLAFQRAFGRETGATLEQLRNHTRILKCVTYLPGYSGLQPVAESEDEMDSKQSVERMPHTRDDVDASVVAQLQDSTSSRVPDAMEVDRKDTTRTQRHDGNGRVLSNLTNVCATGIAQAVRHSWNTRVPRPDMSKVSAGTPMWVPGYIKTAFGQLVHPIPLDSGSPLSLISADLLDTFFAKENIEPMDETIIMGVDGQAIPINGSVKLWISLPDCSDPSRTPLAFEDQLFVISGLQDLVLLGNELISRAKMKICPADKEREWLIQSPLEPMTIIRAYSDERECIPPGAHYRVRTPNGIKMCAGVKPKGYSEPVQLGTTGLKPMKLSGLVGRVCIVNRSKKYEVEEEETVQQQPFPIDSLPSTPPMKTTMVDPVLVSKEHVERLVKRFGVDPNVAIPSDDEMIPLLSDSKLHVDPDVPDHVKQLLKAILYHFRKAISTPSHPIGTIKDGPHFKIRLQGRLPVYNQQSYTMKQREEIRPLIQQMYEADVLEDTETATYACRVSIVRRAPGEKPRLVTNYRPVNQVTRKDIYPIALTTENIKWLLETDPDTGFPRCNYMTDFDANKAYWQVLCADQETKDALAMALPDKIAACKRMPFGPTNAPGHWSRVCDKVLGPYKWKNFTNFYDNLHCSGSTLFDGLWNVALLLERMQLHGMTVSLDKCHFSIAGCDC